MKFIGLGVWITATVISVMSGVVMSGIPGGGMMGELIIIGFYGFNPEVFPIILTIGLLTDPIATMINATGDAVVSMMVTRRIEGKDWMLKSNNIGGKMYNLDVVVDRKNTKSVKYEEMDLNFGSNDMLPFWVADMDIKCPDFMIESIINRAEHGVFGYSKRMPEFYDSIMNWLSTRHQLKVNREDIEYGPGGISSQYDDKKIYKAWCDK